MKDKKQQKAPKRESRETAAPRNEPRKTIVKNANAAGLGAIGRSGERVKNDGRDEIQY